VDKVRISKTTKRIITCLVGSDTCQRR